MRARTAAVLTLLALSALAGVPATASAASATRVCHEPKYPGDGYFTSLTVRGVRCATGSKLAFAYYRCRVRAGGRKGRCTRDLLGFRCVEKRVSIPTEFDARVTCKRRAQVITHTYQQNIQS
jgi:hypothetical protein